MRAALYARVSTLEQADQGSIDTQLGFLRGHCSLHTIEIAGVYPDEDVSGTVPLQERPHGARLLADAAAGLFDVVLVYKVDRLARSVLAFFQAIELIESRQVAFRSATEPVDTATSMGRALLGLLAVFAALERDSILERTFDGRIRCVKAGQWGGGPAPFGYRLGVIRNDRGHDAPVLVPNEEPMACGYSEAAVIRLIYELVVASDLSTQQVCDRLTALGIPSPAYCRCFKRTRKQADPHWRSSTVAALLRRTTYRGVHVFGKIETPCPPLVSPELWEVARERMAARYTAGRGGDREYLLRGMIRCGECGYAYGGSSAMGSRKLPADRWYYVCSGRKQWRSLHPDRAACRGPAVHGPRLERALWARLLKMAEDREETLAQIVRSTDKARETAAQRLQDLGRLSCAMDVLQARRERLNEALIAGAMTAEEGREWKGRLLAQEEQLRRQEAGIRAEWEAALSEQDVIAGASHALDRIAALAGAAVSFEDRRAILQLAFRRVRVFRSRVRQPRIEVEVALEGAAESLDWTSPRPCVTFSVKLDLAA